MSASFHIEFLRAERLRRLTRNPRYSLRTYARDLGMDAGSLSRVLAGERPLSAKAAGKLVSRLKMTPRQRERFLGSIFEEKKHQALRTLPKSAPPAEEPPNVLVDNQLFRIIGNWYHSAILELTYVEGFRSDPYWIAQAIGVSPTSARQAVERLLEAGLLKWVGGALQKTSLSTTTKDKALTSFHLKQHTTQFFQKAIRSFWETPIEERSSTGMTMAIDPARLPLARALIEAFTEELVRTLQTGRKRRVYHLGIALFPVSR